MPQFMTRVTCALGHGDIHFEWDEGPEAADAPMDHAEAMLARLVRLRVYGNPPPGWPKTRSQWRVCTLVRVEVYPADRVGGLPLAERDF